MPCALILRTQNGMPHLITHRTPPTLSVTTSKYVQGVAALGRHTGVAQPSSSGHARRAGGADPLTNDGNQRWYGTISIGSPAVDYTGEPLVHVIGRYLTTLCSGL